MPQDIFIVGAECFCEIDVYDSDTGELLPDTLVLEITDFVCTYAIDSIPVANITLPLGESLDRPGRNNRAAIHSPLGRKLMESINPSPIKVYYQSEMESVDESGKPKQLLVFDGYVKTIIPKQDAVNGPGLRMILDHWLSDANTVSLLSEYTAPDSAYDLAWKHFRANRSGQESRQTWEDAKLTQITSTFSNFDVMKVQEDFWGGGILELYWKRCQIVWFANSACCTLSA